MNRLRKIVGEVECDPQRAFYSEPNWDTQREFDSWVRDARTLEGKQMHHVCTAVAQSTQPDATPLDPQEVVLFIDVCFHNSLFIFFNSLFTCTHVTGLFDKAFIDTPKEQDEGAKRQGKACSFA